MTPAAASRGACQCYQGVGDAHIEWIDQHWNINFIEAAKGVREMMTRNKMKHDNNEGEEDPDE